MSVKSRVQGFVLKLVGPALVGKKGHKGSDAIGTLHVAHWLPFENNRLGFFTVYDGSFEKYIYDFTDKIGPVFDALFPNINGGPPTPVAKNPQAFIQWGLENNYPAIGFYSAYPGLGVQDIKALLADRKSRPGHRCLAVVSMVTSGSIRRYALAKENETQAAPVKEGTGLLRRILGSAQA